MCTDKESLKIEDLNKDDVIPFLLPQCKDVDETFSVASWNRHVKEEADSHEIKSDQEFTINEDSIKLEVFHDEIYMKSEVEDQTIDNSIEDPLSTLQQNIITHTAEEPFQLKEVAVYNQLVERAEKSEQPQLQCNIAESSIKVEPLLEEIETEFEHEIIEEAAQNKHHTVGKRLECSVCDLKFAYKRDLRLHKMTHTGEKPVKCSICEYSCIQTGNLRQHMRIHTGEKPFKCNICDFKCSHKYSLQLHAFTHTGEKSIECSLCEYKCRTKGGLQQHMKIHMKEKLLKCSECDYTSVWKHNLKQHTKIHSDNKEFQCSTCDKRFTQKCTLQQHIKIHTGEKPIKCYVCEYRCNTKSYLREHMKTHTGVKPFECNVCNFKTAWKNNLKKHMRRTHIEET